MNDYKMKIIVAFNPAFFKDEKRVVIQRNAFEVLSKLPKNIFPIAFGFEKDKDHPDVKRFGFKSLNILKKDAKTIVGNDRKLPYIDEILNECSKKDCDVFGYINSDILITHKVNDILHEGGDAFIFSRFDIEEISPLDFRKGKIKITPEGNNHCGADGFFFNREWWIKNNENFTDKLIIGEAEWDTCYRIVIANITNKYIEKRCLYHVYHKDALWVMPGPGAENNHKVHMGLRKRFHYNDPPNDTKKEESKTETAVRTHTHERKVGKPILPPSVSPSAPPSAAPQPRKGFLNRTRWL